MPVKWKTCCLHRKTQYVCVYLCIQWHLPVGLLPLTVSTSNAAESRCCPMKAAPWSPWLEMTSCKSSQQHQHSSKPSKPICLARTNNNNKSICKAQKPFHRDYSKRMQGRARARTHARTLSLKIFNIMLARHFMTLNPTSSSPHYWICKRFVLLATHVAAWVYNGCIFFYCSPHPSPTPCVIFSHCYLLPCC